MSANDRPSEHDEHRMRRQGIVFLSCGVVFLGVGLATKQLVFTLLAPSFIALGVVFLARTRRRPDGGQR